MTSEMHKLLCISGDIHDCIHHTTCSVLVVNIFFWRWRQQSVCRDPHKHQTLTRRNPMWGFYQPFNRQVI